MAQPLALSGSYYHALPLPSGRFVVAYMNDTGVEHFYSGTVRGGNVGDFLFKGEMHRATKFDTAAYAERVARDLNAD